MSDKTNMIATLVLAGGIIALCALVVNNLGAITQPLFAGNPGGGTFYNTEETW